MRKTIALILLLAPLAACGGGEGGADTAQDESTTTQVAPAEAPADFQVVEVRVEGDAYVFSPQSVEAGRAVRLVFDPAGLPGCSRDVTVPAFDIAKVISAGDETIEFTPASQEPIAVACSMNMYRGTLLVE